MLWGGSGTGFWIPTERISRRGRRENDAFKEMTSVIRSVQRLVVVGSLALGMGSALAERTNLLENGSFEDGLSGWMPLGAVKVVGDAFDGVNALWLDPQPGINAEVVQRVEGLTPRMRYTLAARVRAENHLAPPSIGVRNGAQIDKANAWIAVDEEGRWLERRLEFHVDEDSTGVDVYASVWRTELMGVAKIDEVRLFEGRQPAPGLLPGEPPRAEPPPITTVPIAGANLILDPSFSDDSGSAWDLGIMAEVVSVDGTSALRLTSSEDTSRASQVLGIGLPPGAEYVLSAEVKVDPGVVASMYLSGANGFIATASFDNTEWQRLEIPVVIGADWLFNPKVTLENWKNQPGAAWYRDVIMEATGNEWSPTKSDPPALTSEVFFDDFSSGRLDPHRWLVSGKSWGGDNGGVSPLNVQLVHDVDDGEEIIALRLGANGDFYEGPIENAGRKTRVGAAIATRDYYASGRYEVRARIAPEQGVCTAFWPFHYIDYQPAQDAYWHEPNPRRNTEIDWEFPTDLHGNEAEAAEYGIDPDAFSFTNARSNSWGGQFGGEGGEHKGRKVILDESGEVIDLAVDALYGEYHTFTIEWHSGADNGKETIERLAGSIGSVRWYIDGILIDELDDVAFGQGNVPFRGARFWLGTWFPAAGYGDATGWTGDPLFETTEAHIAWVRITPFNEPRDTWVSETVPNLAWAVPAAYPTDVGPLDPEDLDGNGRVDGADLMILLGLWGTPSDTVDLDGSGVVDGPDLTLLLAAWSSG